MIINKEKAITSNEAVNKHPKLELEVIFKSG
jgi:hypothetical protein